MSNNAASSNTSCQSITDLKNYTDWLDDVIAEIKATPPTDFRAQEIVAMMKEPHATNVVAAPDPAAREVLAAKAGERQALLLLLNQAPAQRKPAPDQCAGAAPPANGHSGNGLRRKAEAALRQALNIPAGSQFDFMKALNDAFPVLPGGRIGASGPGRAVVRAPDGGANPANLPAAQAALYRQAQVIAGDALHIVAGLRPATGCGATDKTEAQRAQIETAIAVLVEEFGQPDGPRRERVDPCLAALTQSLAQFGADTGLDQAPDDNTQRAGYVALQGYAATLTASWQSYARPAPDPASWATDLLPLIAEANRRWTEALDAVGFGENSRRSSAITIDQLAPNNWGLPRLTVSACQRWIDQLAGQEGPRMLAHSPKDGLGYVAHQAHIIAMLLSRALLASRHQCRATPLAQVFDYENSDAAMDYLLRQLNQLAGLAG